MASGTTGPAVAVDDGPAAGTAPVAAVRDGMVRGAVRDGLTRFEAIPYAAPPVGALRWSSPAPVPDWTGVRDATAPAPVCPQSGAGLAPGTRMSEDCLYLDVTAPPVPSNGSRPVLLAVHGGGFQSGAGSDYYVDSMVRRSGAVVVTINYRLGILGGFAHPALGRNSAFGLQDQQAALRWVRHNIAAFGGDPGNVTVSGESAGAMMTCSQLTAPAARGLFRKAIIVSGSCLMKHPRNALGPGAPAANTWQPWSAVAKAGEQTATELGCTNPATTLQCLRAMPAKELLKRNTGFISIPYGSTVLPHDPAAVIRAGQAAAVPVIQGNTSDEHLLITLSAHKRLAGDPHGYRRLLADTFGTGPSSGEPAIAAAFPPDGPGGVLKALDHVFTGRDWICPSQAANRALAATTSTWGYVFADPQAATLEGVPIPPGLRPAATHGSDLTAVWGFDAPEARLSPAQRALGRTIAGYWSHFLRSGDPNGPGLPPWPRVSATGHTFGLTLAPEPDGIRTTDITGTHHCELLSPTG
ncbi:carboxylesterase/lipase family protein [Sciscionella marina]|uniref:carboxylesterase/lipase family protein n=1 Tax=Sciscionella marina TaxID=508770 RepID=UPI0003A8AB47|nr:carboxylesterase family protein [Sciscionella marina]